MLYVVLEMQATDSNVATLVNSYTDKNKAEEKYHQVLAAAAVSKVPKHSAVMLTDEGVRLKGEIYLHGEKEE